MKVWCGVYVRAIVFNVSVPEDASVADLQDAIMKATDVRFRVDPSELRLYLAKVDDGWLKYVTLLGGPVSTEFEELNPSWQLKPKLGSDFQSEDGEIHVLVAFPPPKQQIASSIGDRRSKKRRWMEEGLSLTDLWRFSAMELKEVPDSTVTLKCLLDRPLPFRLKLRDDKKVEKICCGVFECADLSTIFNMILMECALYRTSADSWQSLYDALFRLPRHICAANGMDITFRWNRVDTIDTGSDYPHLIVLCEGLVVMRGEEDKITTSGLRMYLSRRKLFHKMRRWNPFFCGDLPFVLGFIARNDCLEIILIDNELVVARSVVKIESVRANPADAIKLFYNLAFLFEPMWSLHKRTHYLSLLPYTPRIKKTCTTELTDNGIKRTRHSLDKQQLARLADIYRNLQELHRQTQERTHLQTIRKLQLPNEKSANLSVCLEPVGTIGLPKTVKEIVEWLRGMLTALKHWHGRGFCHGNVHRRNAKYVPSDDSGYWILIRMDKSHRPLTGTTISAEKRSGCSMIYINSVKC